MGPAVCPGPQRGTLIHGPPVGARALPLEAPGEHEQPPMTHSHDDSLSFMDHLWEPVRCHFRPLVSFSSTGGLRGHGGSVSVLVGARRHRVRGAHAW